MNILDTLQTLEEQKFAPRTLVYQGKEGSVECLVLNVTTQPKVVFIAYTATRADTSYTLMDALAYLNCPD